MSRLAWVVLVTLTVAGLGAASAPTSVVDVTRSVEARQATIPDTGPRQLGPAAQLRKDVQLTPVELSGFDPSKIAAAERLPFNCVVYKPKASSENATPPVEIWLAYKGTEPVKVEQLFVHLVVPQLEGWNFTVSTKNYMLYPNWAWVYQPGSRLPANYNLPPEGQPLLRCEAFGWVKK
jgi:hypothetical protein